MRQRKKERLEQVPSSAPPQPHPFSSLPREKLRPWKAHSPAAGASLPFRFRPLRFPSHKSIPGLTSMRVPLTQSDSDEVHTPKGERGATWKKEAPFWPLRRFTRVPGRRTTWKESSACEGRKKKCSHLQVYAPAGQLWRPAGAPGISMAATVFPFMRVQATNLGSGGCERTVLNHGNLT